MKQLELLGYKCVDRVTGFEGICTSVCFDLYGCVQVLLQPQVKEDGKMPETTQWLDCHRVVSSGPIVMPAPTFERETGPANKPLK